MAVLGVDWLSTFVAAALASPADTCRLAPAGVDLSATIGGQVSAICAPLIDCSQSPDLKKERAIAEAALREHIKPLKDIAAKQQRLRTELEATHAVSPDHRAASEKNQQASDRLRELRGDVDAENGRQRELQSDHAREHFHWTIKRSLEVSAAHQAKADAIGVEAEKALAPVNEAYLAADALTKKLDADYARRDAQRLRILAECARTGHPPSFYSGTAWCNSSEATGLRTEMFVFEQVVTATDVAAGRSPSDELGKTWFGVADQALFRIGDARSAAQKEQVRIGAEFRKQQAGFAARANVFQDQVNQDIANFKKSAEFLDREAALAYEKSEGEKAQGAIRDAIDAQTIQAEAARAERDLLDQARLEKRKHIHEELAKNELVLAASVGTDNLVDRTFFLHAISTVDLGQLNAPGIAIAETAFGDDPHRTPASGDGTPFLATMRAKLAALKTVLEAQAKCEGDADPLTPDQRKALVRAARDQLTATVHGKALGYRQNCPGGCDGTDGYIDCSHAVHRIYEKAGLKYDYLPVNVDTVPGITSSRQFGEVGTRVAKPGDLIVFLRKDGNIPNDHVGVVTQVSSDGTVTDFINAASRRGAAYDRNSPRFAPAMIEYKPSFLQGDQDAKAGNITWRIYRWKK